jgi:hypothetical protein
MTRNPVLELLAEEDLQAIQTRLGAITYRSRLEARWAVAFTQLGLAWQYEPAPIRLHGRNRWPDFWLEREQAWIEVKPAHTPPDYDYALSVAEQTGSPLLWLAGPPRYGGYALSLCGFGGLDEVGGLVFALGRRDKARLWLASPDLSTCFALPISRHAEGDVPRTKCERLAQAYLLAMQWTFEETP